MSNGTPGSAKPTPLLAEVSRDTARASQLPFAIDNPLLRRVRPGKPVHRFLEAAALRGQPFGLPIPVLWEQSYGAHLARNPALIWRVNWLAQLCDPGRGGQVLVALPVRARGAIAAGRILANVAVPKKRRQGTAQQQAMTWERDVLIACTAWDHGYDLVSDDSDLAAIAAALPGCAVRTPEALGFP